MVCHFRPGVLGENLSERDKEVVIRQTYGDEVYKEYQNYHKIIYQPISTVAGPAGALGQQKDEESKVASKKITPLIECTYSAELNPYLFKFKKSSLSDFLTSDRLSNFTRVYSDKKSKRREELKMQQDVQALPTDVEMQPNEELKKIEPVQLEEAKKEPSV